MKKLVFGSLAVTSLLIGGCAKDPAKDAHKCINNQIMIQSAVEDWCEKHDYFKMPTMKQLVEDGSMINQEIKCPTDGAEYTWHKDDDTGLIRVVCPHADKGHAVKEWK